MIRLAGLAALVSLAASPALAIVGGSDAGDPSGARSYTVGIMTTRGEICSGIVVAPRIVLTAAHCLIRGKAEYVMALDPEFRPRQFRAAKSWRNPKFRPGVRPLRQKGTDIGMVELRDPLPADMRPIAVASSADIVSNASSLRIAGFGVAAYGDRASAGRLREATLRPIGLARSGTVSLFASEDGRIGPSRVSACLGDSGGPVVADGGSGPVLVGIISWVGAQEGGRHCEGVTVAAPTLLDDEIANASLARLGGAQAPSQAQRTAAPMNWSTQPAVRVGADPAGNQ